MEEIRFVDTTLRDGHASLWAERMRTGMMLAVAPEMDRAGFVAMEVIATSHFKKCVRELREDPWERLQLLSEVLQQTPMAALAGNPAPGFAASPSCMVELYIQRLVAHGVRRLHLMDASNDISGRIRPKVVMAHECGAEVMIGLVFSESPRHSDAYYVAKAAEAVAAGADVVYLKDPGGLLTPQRVTSLVPLLLQQLDGIPLELHTHCTTGLGPASTMAAVEAGIRTVHTAIPPLANGASQPSIFSVAHNVRSLGLRAALDEEPLTGVAERLRAMARRDQLPEGQPLDYDRAQYDHQVPGGVISNLRHQLSQIGMLDRLPEVLEETVRVREDLGYPIMVTPFSQFVVSQAAINVFGDERYRTITDEVIKYVLGFMGREASEAVADELRDRVTSYPRTRELRDWQPSDPSLREVRESLDATGMSDDDLLLRFMVGDPAEVTRMKEAGPFRVYGPESTEGTAGLSVLFEGLRKQPSIKRVVIRKPQYSLVLESPSAGATGESSQPADIQS